MRFKKWTAALLAGVMLVSLAGCRREEEGSGEAKEVSMGVAVYKFDDTFMTGVRSVMEAEAKAKGASIDVVDSQSTQTRQNEQVDTFITKGMNALAVNPVDRTAAGPIVEKARAKDLPVVFINREPEQSVMNGYDKTWYVGAKAEESGTLAGQIIADYWTANKAAADRNSDGKLQYIMIQGEPGHQDATLRTQYSVEALREAGIEVEELGKDTASWDKVKATDLMKTFITSKGIGNIEAVICNNDDMALGVIEALKAEGYNTGDASKFIPVVGVDATAPALAAMQNGSLLGTVLNDAENQGKAAVHIAIAAAQGKTVDKETIGYDLTDGKYVWIPYVKITRDNYSEYMQ